MKKHLEKLHVRPGSKVNLSSYDPADTDGFKDEAAADQSIKEDLETLNELQEKLYAAGRHSVLIILQAMDAAGKDGVIKHVMAGLNPQGCKVTSYKHPSDEEYDHDFLWRFNKGLPQTGQIGIFNRSHYENVLICRVHPEFIMNEHLPKYDDVKKLKDQFWQHRFKQIRRFEKNLTQNGMVILKFFLHISKEEQRERLLARIENKDKHWKFSFADINERKYWDDYHRCYKEAIQATSTKNAPWYIIPADHKWYTRASIASILVEKLKSLHLKFPVLPEAELKKLEDARELLIKEKK